MKIGILTLIALCVILLVLLQRRSAERERDVPAYGSIEAWIRRETVPLEIGSDERFNAAVDRLLASFGGSVEMLGFGEALHGGEAILILRNRIFQRLVEVHGYTAIALESSFPAGRFTNDYVEGRGPASYDGIKDTGFSHNAGRLDANRELVEWMRTYNADPAHPVKVRFYGFDISGTMGFSSPGPVLQFVLDYLASMDTAGVAERRRKISSLVEPDANWENPAVIADPSKSMGLTPSATALRIETEDLLAELRRRRPELTARGGADRYREALHYATFARELLNSHAALARKAGYVELLGIRDALMADNLAYVADCERGRGKVFVFAHNSHLKRGQAEWEMGPVTHRWWPAGSHLNETLGPRYAVIGSAVGVSDDNGIGRPEPATIEARLMAVSQAALFVPTHLGRGLPSAEIAALPVRSGSPRNPTYFPLTPHSFTDFDGIAFIGETTYNRGGPPLQQWDSGSKK